MEARALDLKNLAVESFATTAAQMIDVAVVVVDPTDADTCCSCC